MTHQSALSEEAAAAGPAATPRVSVVVATYNRARLLEHSLDTVTAQTFGDWECLICDDGSTDDTRALVEARARSDSRFRLVTGARYGLPAGPRNRGLTGARGDWIALLDDDDLWHPKKLERQLAVAERWRCDAVGTGIVYFSEGTVPPRWEETGTAGEPLKLGLAHVLLQRTPYPSTPTNLIRRPLLLAAGGFSEHTAYRAVEDYDLWARLLVGGTLVWRMVGGPPLVAARDAGADSISQWTATLRPDNVRQRWAMLEIACRIAAAAGDELRGELSAVRDGLTALADDCAHRSWSLGWRGAAAVGYALAAAFAARNARATEAARRLLRLARFAALSRTQSHTEQPPQVRPLVRRAARFGAAMVAGRRVPVTPLAIDAEGRWSSLTPPSRERAAA